MRNMEIMDRKWAVHSSMYTQNLGLLDDVTRKYGQDKYKRVSALQHRVPAWNSLTKGVEDLKSLHGLRGRMDKCLKGRSMED